MKKFFLCMAFTALYIYLTSCGARDNKNEAEKYPTYDTTKAMEHKNNAHPDSTASNMNNKDGNVD